jgi:hypothetical protein
VLPGRQSLFSSRLRLCPRRHRCLRLQLIAERPKVLKLSKRSLEWQGRPSRGTPTPPGYGYLTRHLPHKATHARLSGSASRQASPSTRNEEETRHYAQMPKCSGLRGHNEQTPIPRVPLQTGLRFHSRGHEQPPHQRACGTTNPGWLVDDHCTNSAATTSVSGGKTAAAMASGQTMLLKGPHPRPHTRGEDKPSKPKSRRSDRRWHRRSRRRRNLLWQPPPQHRRQRPPARQRHADEWRPPHPLADPHSSPRRRAGTDLHAEASCQIEDKTIQEHERRPCGVRHLGRSPGAHGATVAHAVDGQPRPDQAAGGRIRGRARAS